MLLLLIAVFLHQLRAEVFKPQRPEIKTLEAMDVNAKFFVCGVADRGWIRDPQETGAHGRTLKHYTIDYTSRAKIDPITQHRVHLDAKLKCAELGDQDFLDEVRAHRTSLETTLQSKIDMGEAIRDQTHVYYAIYNCTVILAEP